MDAPRRYDSHTRGARQWDKDIFLRPLVYPTYAVRYVIDLYRQARDIERLRVLPPKTRRW